GKARHGDMRTDDIVDLLVRPDAAEQEKRGKQDREQLLAAGGLNVLYVRSNAHPLAPFVFVLGRNCTTRSQSSASAMRTNVSIRGGRPPRSKRAIADCVVPTRSANSCCERSRARRCSTTCSAIAAKSQPSSGAPATRSRSSSSRLRSAVSFRRDIASEL